jgi:ribosomal protein L37AE/L43A
MEMEVDRDDMKILCPFCNSMNCFQEEYKTTKSWLCMNCGYTSLNLYKNHSSELKEILNSSPQLIIDLKKYDEERQIWWFLSVINIPNKGILYPEGTPEIWEWVYAPSVPIPEEERKDYPIPNQDDRFYDSRLAIEQSQRFPSDQFYNAIKEMGAIVDF